MKKRPCSWRGVHDRYHAARAILHARFPAVFTARGAAPVPLKIGIADDLLAVPDLGITPDQVRYTLHLWTGRRVYQELLLEGASRHDLDGNPAGTVTAAHAGHAAAVLAGTRKHRPPRPREDVPGA